jgi:hypothetical protein
MVLGWATLRIWNTVGAGSYRRQGALPRSPWGHRAAGFRGGAVVLWDLERAEKLAVVQHRGPISSLTFTEDPNRFFAASQDGAVSLFDVRSPNTPAPLSDEVEGGAQLLALARLRGMLVTGGQDRGIRLWRTDSHALVRTWRTDAAGIVALDIAPSGRTIASAAPDGSVRLWTTTSSRAQRTLNAHQGRVTALAFAPNGGMLATTGEDGNVKVWTIRGGRTVPRTLRGHTGPVRAASFTADGQRLVSAGRYDPHLELVGPAREVRGRRLAAGPAGHLEQAGWRFQHPNCPNYSAPNWLRITRLRRAAWRLPPDRRSPAAVGWLPNSTTQRCVPAQVAACGRRLVEDLVRPDNQAKPRRSASESGAWSRPCSGLQVADSCVSTGAPVAIGQLLDIIHVERISLNAPEVIDVPVRDRHLTIVRGEGVRVSASELDSAVQAADPIVELALGQLADRMHELQRTAVAASPRSCIGWPLFRHAALA